MSKDKAFDFRYAVENTEILIPPTGRLETFGDTLLGYVLVSESPDDVGRCKVRTGTMRMKKPLLLTPEAYAERSLEGFSDEARKYLDWLRDHGQEVHVLRYGYQLSRESFSEQEISRPAGDVLEDAARDVKARKDPWLALVRGVEDPWDVCLVRLFMESVSRSARHNIEDFAKRRLAVNPPGGVSPEVRQQIEEAFAAAARDPSLRNRLGALLQKHDVFPAYEERFFALFRDQK